MVSYRRQTVFCCIGFMTFIAIAAVARSADVLLPASEEYAPVLRSIAGIALVLSLLPVVFLALVLNRRMRVDIDRLLSGIHQLALPDRDEPQDTFRYEEFGECARKLREVARTLSERQERLNDGASRDALTGLPNRRTMKYVLSREVAFAERTGWPLSLVMVDIDHFKALNDTYGHQAGDHVLERTARRLDSLVRSSDVVARYGGEEFVLIFPGTGLDMAVEVAQQLRNALRCDRFAYDSFEIAVTASFGVAELHSCEAQGADALIARADGALYEAKKQGRDRVVAARPTTEVRPVGDEPAPDQTPPALPAPAKARPSPATTSNEPVDRDTMSLMGSIYSILQLLPDRQRVAQDVVQQMAVVVHSPRAILYALDTSRGQLAPLATSRIEERDRLAAVETPTDLRQWFDAQALGDTAGICQQVEPEVVPGRPDELYPAYVRVPMTAYGELIGVAVAPVEESEFELGQRQKTILSALGTIGATALRTCGVFARQEEGWVGLIESLCRAIHSNDAFKQSHGRKVADMAVVLARALGQQDRDALQLMRVAGMVHDIGKVGLPAQLFKKKGRLRAGERKQMQEHCRIGAELLTSVTQLQHLSKIVRHHHEHFDGGGYPDGLAGTEIPIESRIIAVADAYDAMTHDRPFRPALTHDEAIRRIRDGAMTQFDPAVVSVFLELFESEAHCDMLLSASFHDVASWTPNPKTPAPLDVGQKIGTSNLR